MILGTPTRRGLMEYPFYPMQYGAKTLVWFNLSSNEVRNLARPLHYTMPSRGEITNSSNGWLTMRDPIFGQRIFKERLHWQSQLNTKTIGSQRFSTNTPPPIRITCGSDRRARSWLN